MVDKLSVKLALQESDWRGLSWSWSDGALSGQIVILLLFCKKKGVLQEGDDRRLLVD
jgi:hypothetical protein